MRFIIAFIAIVMMIGPNSASAGRLGTCWECFTENGASFHRWDKNNVLGGQCGLLEGNAKKGDPTICDANEGGSLRDLCGLMVSDASAGMPDVVVGT